MSQTAATPQNIVLIGFMGSGKSTVGRELHQRLGYPLIDMDRLIEETMGKKISEIFKSNQTFFSLKANNKHSFK